MNKTKLLYLGLGIALSATSCGENKPVTHTRQIDEACDAYDNCKNGLACENGICRQTCENNSECPDGYHCEDNICAKGGYNSCGDGIVNTGEECDDNNNVDGDGCSKNCTIEAGWACDNSSQKSICSKTCGNGEEDTGELCDDRNNLDGDGCSSKCNIEANYKCTGFPSVCECTEGFQDSNGDGLCKKDCTESCTGDYVCLYDNDGVATGCGCPQGQQDSNSDGSCQPDCNCGSTEQCNYDENGLASCSCKEGLQDNDGDGVCTPTCRTFIVDNPLDSFQGCDDSDGTAKKICVMYVKFGATGGDGSSWEKPSRTISEALNQLETLRTLGQTDETTAPCSLWLHEKQFTEDREVSVKNVNIIGGFKGNEVAANERPSGNKTPISGTQIGTKGYLNQYRIFNTSGVVKFDGIQFTSGYIASSDMAQGGAIYSSDNTELTIDNCSFTGNKSTNSTKYYARGGAIAITGGKVNINSSFFQKNSSDQYGGSIYLDGCNTHITETVFDANSLSQPSQAFGAAISLVNNSSAVITKSKFIGNSVGSGKEVYGGAIYSNSTSLTIKDCWFISNKSSSGGDGHSLGGAIYYTAPEDYRMVIQNSYFVDNKSYSVAQTTIGGTIYNTSKSALLDGIIIASSQTGYTYTSDCYTGGAAGIYNNGQDMVINNSILAGLQYVSSNNKCSDLHGAAIYNDKDGSISINYSLLYDNLTLGSTNENVYDATGDYKVIIRNSLQSDGQKNTSDNIFIAASAIDMKNDMEHLKETWVSAAYDAQTYTTKLVASKDFWQPGELVNSLLVVEDSTTYYLPIVENGANYVVVPTTNQTFTLGSDTVANIMAEKTIDIRNPRHVVRKGNNEALNLIDQADSSAGPQPTTDINGNPRPQGAGPDIGPFEIQ